MTTPTAMVPVADPCKHLIRVAGGAETRLLHPRGHCANGCGEPLSGSPAQRGLFCSDCCSRDFFAIRDCPACGNVHGGRCDESMP